MTDPVMFPVRWDTMIRLATFAMQTPGLVLSVPHQLALAIYASSDGASLPACHGYARSLAQTIADLCAAESPQN